MITCIFILAMHTVASFNLDTKFPIIYEDPSKRSEEGKVSYFGYSVVLSPGDEDVTRSWIFIGAPRGDSELKRSGTVFRCPIELMGNSEHCQRLLNVSQTAIEHSENFVDHGAWIGGVMDIHVPSGSLVVCGPHWMTDYTKISAIRDVCLTGMCFFLNVKDNIEQILVPLKYHGDINLYFKTVGKKKKENKYYYMHGQAGFSAHFSKSTTNLELLLGAPNVLHSMGSSVMYRSDSVKGFPDFEKNANLIIPELSTKDDSNANYAGYQVSSGYFFNKDLYYVIGAPRFNFKGQIRIFNFVSKSSVNAKSGFQHEMKVHQMLEGYQTGEYFGSVLAVGDINGDSLDDLLVGAPYHCREGYKSDYSINKFNEGKVYVFLGDKSKKMIPAENFGIIGRVGGGMFGSAITILGDMNLDSYMDVAISAPYEDKQRGVVYIYMGSKVGISDRPSQTIYAKNIDPNLKGFGLGLSRAVDVDRNGYNDLAVGAYLSGHAVVFRSNPVVTLKQSLKASVVKVDYSTKNFSIKICYWFEGEFLPEFLTIFRSLYVDNYYGRWSLGKSVLKYSQMNLTRNQVLCNNETITIKDEVQNNKTYFQSEEPIEIISIISNETIVEGNIYGFCKTCPILNASSILEEKLEVPFTPCGEDSGCLSCLQIYVKVLGLRNDGYVIIGDGNRLKLEVVVQNSDSCAPAYFTELEIRMPSLVKLTNFLRNCVVFSNVVKCKLQNPLKDMQNLTFEINIKDVGDEFYEGEKYFTQINISISTITEDVNKDNNSISVPIHLKIEADLTMNGDAGNYSTSFDPSFKENIYFTQVFELQKYGPGLVEEALMQIYIPKEIVTQEKNLVTFLYIYEVEAYHAEQPINCDYDGKDVEWDTSGGDTSGEVMSVLDGHQQNRRKRSYIDQSNEEFSPVTPLNRTLFLNCSSSAVNCAKIDCVVGPLKGNKNSAHVSVKMILNVKIISELMEKKDVLYFSSNGKVDVIKPKNFQQSGNLTDVVRLSNVFLGKISDEPVNIRLIILAGVVGILSLSTIITGLHKGRFFERTSKLKLQELKEQSVLEEFLLTPGARVVEND